MGGEIVSQELDVAVFQYLEEDRAEGRCVRNQDLQEKALELADTHSLDDLKATNQWVCCWKKRWNIGFRRGRSCAQRVAADYQEQLCSFHHTILRHRVLHSLDPSQVWNMDQTICRSVKKFCRKSTYQYIPDPAFFCTQI